MFNSNKVDKVKFSSCNRVTFYDKLCVYYFSGYLYLVYSGDNIDKTCSKYFGAANIYCTASELDLEQLLRSDEINSDICEFGLLTTNGLTVKEDDRVILELQPGELLVFEATKLTSLRDLNHRLYWKGEMTLHFHPKKKTSDYS